MTSIVLHSRSRRRRISCFGVVFAVSCCLFDDGMFGSRPGGSHRIRGGRRCSILILAILVLGRCKLLWCFLALLFWPSDVMVAVRGFLLDVPIAVALVRAACGGILLPHARCGAAFAVVRFVIEYTLHYRTVAFGCGFVLASVCFLFVFLRNRSTTAARSVVSLLIFLLARLRCHDDGGDDDDTGEAIAATQSNSLFTMIPHT
mmetsp:Transcript_17579/g.33011  ORF Transcript_17579/g.33011 Transcript_17579/m.33011 type:complete len:203 (+) Transcript_17579:3942-4550(+)